MVRREGLVELHGVTGLFHLGDGVTGLAGSKRQVSTCSPMVENAAFLFQRKSSVLPKSLQRLVQERINQHIFSPRRHACSVCVSVRDTRVGGSKCMELTLPRILGTQERPREPI